MSYQSAIPISSLIKKRKLSERQLAIDAGVSRTCLRHIMASLLSCSIHSVVRVAKSLGMETSLLVHPREVLSDYSTVATGYKILRDGVDSWKIHIFDMVDEFRRTLDPRLLLLPPPRLLDLKLKALFSGVVEQLTIEAGISPPQWIKQHYYLETPWFVSGIESLKASAILESPLAFRRNNIFVQENFLSRT